MTERSGSRGSRGSALILALATCAIAAVGLGFAFAARRATLPENIGFPGYWSIVAIGSTASGTILALRRPANPIGWLFLGGGLVWAVVQLGDGYAAWAIADRGSTTVGARLAAATLEGVWIPAQASLALVFTLFPDGRFLSRRWRTWTLVATVVTLVATVANTTADPLTIYVGRSNPIGVAWLGPIAGPALGGLAILLVIGLANLVVRFRRSADDERQQIKWLVPSTIVIALAYLVYVIGFAIPDRKPTGLAIGIVEAMLLLALATIPIAIAIGVLKYRLYDIDVVIKKTVIFGFLVGLLLAVGGVVLLLVGLGVVPSLYDSPPLLLIVGVAFGLLLIPLYRVATRVADRIVYAGRDTPYEVLSAFSAQVGGAYSDDDVLPRMATVLREGTRAEVATVWLSVGGELRPAAVWPPEASAPVAPPDQAVDVHHQGERLGALSVAMPANDPLDPRRTTLIRDLAAQAGPVLRNVRLIEELRASRQRLVAAQDQERRRIERNIHDGAQQQLVALSVQLRLAEHVAERDPAKARAMMADLQIRTTEALEELRDLARGIYPPLLADQGLAAALEAQGRKAAFSVSVLRDGVERYPQEVEAAVYFCALEALQNTAKYADASTVEIRLTHEGDRLTFEIRDDGRGFDPGAALVGSGLQGMADRIEAIGGALEVRSRPGGGTAVSGSVPVG